jgi:hypothetical protein
MKEYLSLFSLSPTTTATKSMLHTQYVYRFASCVVVVVVAVDAPARTRVPRPSRSKQHRSINNIFPCCFSFVVFCAPLVFMHVCNTGWLIS